MFKIEKYRSTIAAFLGIFYLVLIGTIGFSGSQSDAGRKARTSGPKQVILQYEKALNAGNVDKIVELYAKDGVFMAQHQKPALGQKQVKRAYQGVFKMIRLAIKFSIDELVKVSPTVAYARTRSAGITTIVANGAKVPEGNQEIFILKRKNTSSPWKISRYIFSTTNPRPTPCSSPKAKK